MQKQHFILHPHRDHRSGTRGHGHNSRLLFIVLIFMLAGVTSVNGQWFPPKVSVDGNGGSSILSNGTGIPEPLALSSYTCDDGASLSIGYDGMNYTVSLSDANMGSGSGTYDPGTHAFTVSGYTVSGLNADGSPWPPQVSAGGPPAAWVNGNVWPLISSATDSSGNGMDYYGSVSGQSLVVTNGGFVISDSGGNLNGAGGSYANGVFYTGNAGVDLRSCDTSGNVLTPNYGPSYGPPGVLIKGSLWKFLGTNTSDPSTPGNYFDIYAGDQPGQTMQVGGGWFNVLDPQSTSTSGSYSNGLFISENGTDIRARNTDGSFWVPPYSPASGPPAVLVNGQLWRFQASSGSMNYDVYVGDQTGQYLQVGSGSFALVDSQNGNNNSGTYSNGLFSGQSPSPTILARNADGSMGSPASGLSGVYVNGNYWGLIAAMNGYDYYSSNYPWQLLSISGSYVRVYDYPAGLSGTGWYSTGAFSVSGADIETTPPPTPHGSSSYGSSTIWSNGTQYNWQSGFTDYNGNNYDFYMDCNGMSNHLTCINGSFGSGVDIQTSPPNTNTDTTTTNPPPSTPTSATFGPSSIWVNGIIYAWSSVSFNDDFRSSGADNYTDGSGHWATVNYTSWSGALYPVSGTSQEGNSFSGSYDRSGNFMDVSGADVRAADSNFNVAYSTAPSGLPPVIRVDAPSPLWHYLGSTNGNGTTYHYGGSQGGQRITINYNGLVLLGGFNNGATSGLYSQGVFWTDQHDVRAMMDNGQPFVASSQSMPTWGPPWVRVYGTIWRYMGKWDGSISYPSSNTPTVADYYVGDNAGQRLSIDPNGNVSISNINDEGQAGSGTYSQGVFSMGSMDVVALDVSGNVINQQPAGPVGDPSPPVNGPPSIWVNGVIFSHPTVSSEAITYGDGAGDYVQVGSNGAACFTADSNCLWSGSYQPSSSDQVNTGVFVVTTSANGAVFDVRAYNDSSPIHSGMTPQTGHPARVWVNGTIWTFQGQTTPESGQSQSTLDYYFGDDAGQRMVIDADGNVEFWTDTSTPPTTVNGFLTGTVFVVNGFDLRALNEDNSPVAPSDVAIWGPPNVWVDGLVWNRLGTVNDSIRQIYGDYYAGPNTGQVLTVNRASQVVSMNSTITGTYTDGVFVATGGDIRALDGQGKFPTPPAPPTGVPSTLRIGGLHWNYLGSTGGVNYYVDGQSGQRLSMDVHGNVAYSDTPHNIGSATGTYNAASSIFTAGSGGTSYNAGTIVGDLDILGNVLSLGSLADNKNTAGLTIGFRDDRSAQAGPSATVEFAASRAITEWWWSRASDQSSDSTTPMMKLDSAHRLNLFSPSDPAAPAIVLDPSGLSRFNGPIHIEPQGDLDMGEFQASR